MTSKPGVPPDDVGLLSTVPAPGQPGSSTQVIIIQAPPPSITYDNYQKRVAMRLTIARLVLAILCICCGAVLAGLQQHIVNNTFFFWASYRYDMTKVSDSHVFAGFWCGVLFIVFTSFGFPASKTGRKAFIITHMVLSIVASILSLGLILPNLNGIVVTVQVKNEGIVPHQQMPGETSTRKYPTEDPAKPTLDACLAFYSILAILGFIHPILSIWSSVLCCRAACCGSKTQNQEIQPVNMPAGGAQYFCQGEMTGATAVAVPPGYQGNPPAYSPAST